MIKLTPRLEKIAGLIENSRLTADIGTDHAYLPAALIERGRAERAIASDINEGPLKRAADTVRAAGLESRILLRLGAGLETVTPSDGADTIVIAGMGGETIAAILEKSPGVVSRAKLIIVQPMSSAPELRDYIYGRGFKNIRECLAEEGDKLYNIISMSPGSEEHKPLAPHERLAGRDLLERRPEHFDKYIKNLTNALSAKADGLARSASPDARAELERTRGIIAALSEQTKEIKE